MITHQHILPPSPARIIIGIDLDKRDPVTTVWVRDNEGRRRNMELDDVAREQVEGHLPYTRNQTNRFGGRS